MQPLKQTQIRKKLDEEPRKSLLRTTDARKTPAQREELIEKCAKPRMVTNTAGGAHGTNDNDNA